MKTILALLLSFSLTAIACDVDQKRIDDLVEKGDITIFFKPNGTVSAVHCDITKYTNEQCKLTGEKVFDYYYKHRKG